VEGGRRAAYVSTAAPPHLRWQHQRHTLLLFLANSRERFGAQGCVVWAAKGHGNGKVGLKGSDQRGLHGALPTGHRVRLFRIQNGPWRNPSGIKGDEGGGRGEKGGGHGRHPRLCCQRKVKDLTPREAAGTGASRGRKPLQMCIRSTYRAFTRAAWFSRIRCRRASSASWAIVPKPVLY
jgi:hypothetical protein